jgi:hypothetical protein
MKSTEPSRLALWLLNHQIGGYRTESLAGDLVEEYTQGRSTGWLWGQILVALARGCVRAVRLYGLRFLGALAAGWGILFLLITLSDQMQALVQHRLSLISPNLSALQLRALDLFFGIAGLLLTALIDFGAGRLVVRIYRPHPRVMAGVFALSILVLWDLPWMYDSVKSASTESQGLLLLCQGLIFTLVWTASVWLGGLWQIRIDARGIKQ